MLHIFALFIGIYSFFSLSHIEARTKKESNFWGPKERAEIGNTSSLHYVVPDYLCMRFVSFELLFIIVFDSFATFFFFCVCAYFLFIVAILPFAAEN